MVKASTLYIVIVISLIIGVISASLITIAFYYKLEEQKKLRMDRLISNLDSGTTLLLSDQFTVYDEDQILDLYDEGVDSIVINKSHWGVFDLNTVKAFQQRDTLKRSFLNGNRYSDASAIYLADEDRPLSLSGNTRITGNGELPKAGLKQAYVDGKAYTGKELIKGSIKDSGRDLPGLNEDILKGIIALLDPLKRAEDPPALLKNADGNSFANPDSIVNSFFNGPQVYILTSDQQNIAAMKIKGRVVLLSDTVVNIEAGTELEDVQIYAQSIRVADGFKGSAQLFARDSVIIGKNCEFKYPSFVGVFKPEDGKIQSKVSIGEGTVFSGILLSYEKKRSDLQTIISIAKDCIVSGEVFATGYVKMDRLVKIHGKVSAKRFMMQTPATLYENYLIDIELNRKLLSKYYLGSPLFKRDKANKQILKWLN